MSASHQYGAGFGTLLWASPKTQAVRFKALLSWVDVHGKAVLDVGSGRADLLEYILSRGRFPKTYYGIEAIDALATAADAKHLPNCRIIRGDFVRNPELMRVNADVVMFSGSLNTMDRDSFYSCLRAGFDTAGSTLVFNFLASPLLASSSHLTWHKPEEVLAFAQTLSRHVKISDTYLRGDATISVWKDKL